MKKLCVARFILLLILVCSCAENQSIVNNIDEREANEIIVFLASKGIEAEKIKASTTETTGGATIIMWGISVPPSKAVEAMALLNQNGLPRKKETTLLQLFAKEGLMTSDKEEKIRYQAGIEKELENTIRKIDGIIDVTVQISFPSSEEILPTETTKAKIKAAVYIKHQGIFDDPNAHLETKIRRLLAGSIDGLDFENVTVIADKARLADISQEKEEIFTPKKDQEYVSLWSMIMTKSSLSKFRLIFFSLILLIIGLGTLLGWIVYKFHPHFFKAKVKEKTDLHEEEKK